MYEGQLNQSRKHDEAPKFSRVVNKLKPMASAPETYTLRQTMLQSARRAGRGAGRRLPETSPAAIRAADAARDYGSHPGPPFSRDRFVVPGTSYRRALRARARQAVAGTTLPPLPDVFPLVRPGTPPRGTAAMEHGKPVALRGGGPPSGLLQDDIVGWSAVALTALVAAITPFQSA